MRDTTTDTKSTLKVRFVHLCPNENQMLRERLSKRDYWRKWRARGRERQYLVLEALLKVKPMYAHELAQLTGDHPIGIGKLLKRKMLEGKPVSVKNKFSGKSGLRLWSYVY